MLASFIIPAYNAADTIVRCLDSIYGLSLKREEFEVIVIDDCSTDETVSIIEDWRKSIDDRWIDDRLTILRQMENHRQGAARNRGVKVAKGDYICFVDADDAVTEGIVKTIRLAKEKMADLTILHYTEVNENKRTSNEGRRLDYAEGEIFAGIEMQNKYPYWCSAPWGYIYDKEFLKKVNYPFAEDVLYEDADFIMVHLYHAEMVSYSPELAYVAYYREGSTTRSISYKNVADYLLLGERMLRFYETIVKREEVRGKRGEGSQSKDDRLTQFAEGILEGACYNVAKACKNLLKLRSTKEVKVFYERVDGRVSRNDIYGDENIRKYSWNLWTALCLKHKKLATMLLAMLMPMYKLVKS